MFKRLQEFHRTRAGYVVFWLVEAVIAYGFGSLAIDRGNFWWYILALIFIVGSLQNFFKLLGTFVHGRH